MTLVATLDSEREQTNNNSTSLLIAQRHLNGNQGTLNLLPLPFPQGPHSLSPRGATTRSPIRPRRAHRHETKKPAWMQTVLNTYVPNWFSRAGGWSTDALFYPLHNSTYMKQFFLCFSISFLNLFIFPFVLRTTGLRIRSSLIIDKLIKYQSFSW